MHTYYIWAVCDAIFSRNIKTSEAKNAQLVSKLRDHVHMHISIAPKYAVAQGIGFIKGKSAIRISRTFGGRARDFVGERFWARGYYASTVGRDENVIREYINKHEVEDIRLEKIKLLKLLTTFGIRV